MVGSLYVNGVQQFSFTDSTNDAVITAAQLPRFLSDDSEFPGEDSAGAVARVRSYDAPLTAAEVGG
ncbi:MAG: LamG domain-containing protein, partial [Actinobacteria bacterium]|nr:LamG domain-containing protein [Actinomycetota bacterium]